MKRRKGVRQKFVAAECGDQHAKSVRSLSMSATTSATANVNDPVNKRDEVDDVVQR